MKQSPQSYKETLRGQRREMSVPKGVKRLVERFERNRDAYRSSDYNEAQVRLELINPFFKALGWDVYNEAGYAEAYKEVIHEDAIKVGGATKAPDYCFRIGGTRKFFVEAKRPSVGIKDDPDAAADGAASLKAVECATRIPVARTGHRARYSMGPPHPLPALQFKRSCAVRGASSNIYHTAEEL